MDGSTVCAVICIMLLTILFCIPVSYKFYIHIHAPCHINMKIQWLHRALYYELDYRYGMPLQTKCYIRWKKYHSKDKEKKIKPDDASPEGHDSTRRKNSPWWSSYIINKSFIENTIHYLLKLLSHSRIRKLYLDGVLGLSEPYETGILAGALYAAIPDNITALHFNFVEEEYDCRSYAAGQAYPAVLVMYTMAFVLSRPTRNMLPLWFKKERKKQYG